ncbi:hypothetical protein HAP93_04390 [Acidithiobacillus ferriphilus]|uniref:phosphorylase family protein n=1 Tax=Acidithiobacillus ferriphilus TaxID=1689834 RepID=UPI001C061772|nr:hypothetical protein [Acidithiobacillus ferriphilus]MBU2785011.1 hypothetical protein [Acidithiobacillus ferriphilus]
MRFLIVDDDPNKISIIKGFLIEKGLCETDILTTEHAAGARKLLERESIDVLLIDVLLPVRRGASPDGRNSVELLRQIVEDGTTPSPRYIFGITASRDALERHGEDFQSLVTQVFHVAPCEDSWRVSLGALLLLLRRVEDSRTFNDYDICVLTALRNPEFVAVNDIWPMQFGEEKLLGSNIIYRTGTVELYGAYKRVICAHLSQMGPIASTHATTALLNEFRPRVLLMTGICGGFRDKVSIGDLIVAEISWDWQAGKWNDQGNLATASDQRGCAARLLAESRGLNTALNDFYAACKGPRPSQPPSLILGPMVTGSSVIASSDIQRIFRGQHRNMVGVDMECYGLYYAAENHVGAPVDVICLKAVSDLADHAKGDNFHEYCSRLSAFASLELVRRYFRNGEISQE